MISAGNLIGCITLTVGCGYIGFVKSKQLKHSVEQISDLIRAVSILRGELFMNLTPVYESCRIVSTQIEGDIGNLFGDCESFSKTIPFADQWQDRLSDHKTALPQSVKKELLQLADFFGKYDVESQLSGLDQMLKRLEACRTDALEQYEIHGPLYRRIGVSVGLILGILLL